MPLVINLIRDSSPVDGSYGCRSWGGTAVGGTAVGGTAVGGIAVGGTAVGGTAVGGTAVGGTAVGGTAVGAAATATAVGVAALGSLSIITVWLSGSETAPFWPGSAVDKSPNEQAATLGSKRSIVNKRGNFKYLQNDILAGSPLNRLCCVTGNDGVLCCRSAVRLPTYIEWNAPLGCFFHLAFPQAWSRFQLIQIQPIDIGHRHWLPEFIPQRWIKMLQN